MDSRKFTKLLLHVFAGTVFRTDPQTETLIFAQQFLRPYDSKIDICLIRTERIYKSEHHNLITCKSFLCKTQPSLSPLRHTDILE